jgi:hypothetical protein
VSRVFGFHQAPGALEKRTASSPRRTAGPVIDDLEDELPLGAPGRLFGGPLVRHRLERMFAFRRALTRAACEVDPSPRAL